MDMSRKINVVKRDGSMEPFDVHKLAASLRRAGCEDGYREAIALASGMCIHLVRKGVSRIDHSEILGMVRKILGDRAFDGMTVIELHCRLRDEMRKEVFVRYDDGNFVRWDKSWMVGLIHRMWDVSIPVSRILAGEIEMELLESTKKVFDRNELVRIINVLVSAFGLADAVSVRQYETGE